MGDFENFYFFNIFYFVTFVNIKLFARQLLPPKSAPKAQNRQIPNFPYKSLKLLPTTPPNWFLTSVCRFCLGRVGTNQRRRGLRIFWCGRRGGKRKQRKARHRARIEMLSVFEKLMFFFVCFWRKKILFRFYFKIY